MAQAGKYIGSGTDNKILLRSLFTKDHVISWSFFYENHGVISKLNILPVVQNSGAHGLKHRNTMPADRFYRIRPYFSRKHKNH